MENQHDSATHDIVTRREFTVQSALAILSTVVITVSGCDDDEPTPTSPTLSDIQGNVAANHAQPHVVTVTSAQITAGTAVTLTLTGTPTHTHTVELTQSELGTLRNRQPVTKTSTTDNGHSHGVTFTPA
jgi:microcystin-dependent protein